MVVVTGYSGSTYYINDPIGGKKNTTLQAQGYVVDWLYFWNGTPPEPPAEFSKTSPGNVSQNINPANLTFSWDSVNPPPWKYYFCVEPADGTSPCPQNVPDWERAQSTQGNIWPGQLNPGQTYRWQVQAWFGVNDSRNTYANNGTWWSFTTAPGVPAAFSKISPADGAVNQSRTPTLSWGTNSGATGYEYCVGTSPTNSCLSDADWGYVSTNSVIVSLIPNTIYYWQVRAINSAGKTPANEGVWWSFNTNLPGTFNKTSPANGAVNQSLKPTLSWGPSSGATSYEYCYSSAAGPCTQWNSVSANSVLLPQLNANTTYYWQVRAKNLAGTSDANEGVWSFTTAPQPGAFNKTAPSNGATNVSLSPTLSWQASTGPVTYYEYCYSSAPGPCHTWFSVGNATSVSLNGLFANYTYYWQVRAIGPGGVTESNGSWWSFTTQTASACSWPAYTPPTTPTFADVPMNVGHWSWVERLANSTITAGCGNGNFCPLTEVVRAQMAIFLLRSKYCGSSYAPPDVGDSTGFADVPLDVTYAPWVKQLAVEGITAGCGNGNFCPQQIVNRAQMAIFLLRAKHGATYSPPVVGSSTGFADVPLDATYAPWVKQLAAEGVTSGCGNGNFCPLQNVNRAQLATFLVRAFNLP